MLAYWIWLLVMLGGLALVPASGVFGVLVAATGNYERSRAIGIATFVTLVAGALAAMYLL